MSLTSAVAILFFAFAAVFVIAAEITKGHGTLALAAIAFAVAALSFAGAIVAAIALLSRGGPTP